jgi:hypothetical protein
MLPRHPNIVSKQPRLDIILIGFASQFPTAFAAYGNVFSRISLVKRADQISLVMVVF